MPAEASSGVSGIPSTLRTVSSPMEKTTIVVTLRANELIV